MRDITAVERPWYAGITRYQWFVLLIACLGWIFDVFQGQIFALLKTPMMIELLGVAKTDPNVSRYSDVAFASFLVGGAVGGLLFGILADRIGRRQAMVWSILTYSVFTGLHYFATNVAQIVVLRFFVAVGVAGEWAVAASLVAEVFPQKARAVAGGIFHASGIAGGVVAAGVSMILADPRQWRLVFLLGMLPALLIIWILASLKESEKWQAAAAAPSPVEGSRGGLRELLGTPQWRSRALVGFGLGAIGLATYWGIFAWAPELVHDILAKGTTDTERQQSAGLVYLLMTVLGALPGQLMFAPITKRTNRRIAFAIYYLGALITVPIAFLCAATYMQAVILLSISSFFVAGMHSGYAIYFPELFPTRLRATGASFCFNVGRGGAAALLFLRVILPASTGVRYGVSVMSLLFLIALFLLLFAPETKGKELPT
jgi:MFS family permease